MAKVVCGDGVKQKTSGNEQIATSSLRYTYGTTARHKNGYNIQLLYVPNVLKTRESFSIFIWKNS